MCEYKITLSFPLTGLGRFFRFFGCLPGPRKEVIKILNAGEIVSISPGGLREALFSSNYSLLWGNREGFAKVALEARVVSIYRNTFLLLIFTCFNFL